MCSVLFLIYLEYADSAIRCQKTHNHCHKSAVVTHTTSWPGLNKQRNKQTTNKVTNYMELIGSQLVKKLPTVYETRRFITVFTTACHFTWFQIKIVFELQ